MKKQMERTLIENEELRKIKDAEIKEAAAHEIQLMKEYAEMLERQERAREENLKKTFEKQKKLQHAHEQSVGQSLREKEIEVHFRTISSPPAPYDILLD